MSLRSCFVAPYALVLMFSYGHETHVHMRACTSTRMQARSQVYAYKACPIGTMHSIVLKLCS